MSLNPVIVLRGKPIVDEQNGASAAITPGMLIEINSGQWRPHSTPAGAGGRVFALERDEVGREIDVPYEIGDAIKAGYFRRGDRVNAILASGESVTEGTFLNSAGDGRLQAGTSEHIAQAAEDVDATGGEVRVSAIIV